MFTEVSWNGKSTLTASVFVWYHFYITLQWSHNDHDGVWNHMRLDCLLNRLIRRRSKKTSKFHVTGLCEGNPPVTGGLTSQRASNAENVFIWWRHRRVPATMWRHRDCDLWTAILFLIFQTIVYPRCGVWYLWPLLLTYIKFNPSMDK